MILSPRIGNYGASHLEHLLEYVSCVLQQQEQDPTNLYMANLPPHFKENDVDQLLAKFGQVVSTRILRDTHGHSKGVGFARMESREKCEQIIQVRYTYVDVLIK